MIHDQADVLRQLVRQAAALRATGAPAAPLLAVIGGKGGVGTTTIALNLAVALARQGRRAVYVDADLDHGGHPPCGHHAEGGSVLDVLTGKRGVHEVLSRGPSGIQVLCGAWATGQSSDVPPAAQDRFVAELQGLAPHAEAVVVDAGSSRAPFARRLWQSASCVLAVTTCDDTAIMQAYAAIKVLAANDAAMPVHTLVNLVADGTLAGDVHQRMDEACRRFLGISTTCAGSVAVCESSSGEGTLVFPSRGEAARALDRAADLLWAQLQLAGAAVDTRRAAMSRC